MRAEMRATAEVLAERWGGLVRVHVIVQMRGRKKLGSGGEPRRAQRRALRRLEAQNRLCAQSDRRVAMRVAMRRGEAR